MSGSPRRGGWRESSGWGWARLRWDGHGPRAPGSGRCHRGRPERTAAHRLGLSHSTVKHHLANARSKLGASTTAQLMWILAPRLREPEAVAQPDE
jgi:hypothetical protein